MSPYRRCVGRAGLFVSGDDQVDAQFVGGDSAVAVRVEGCEIDSGHRGLGEHAFEKRHFVLMFRDNAAGIDETVRMVSAVCVSRIKVDCQDGGSSKG